jgi:hypothetical protein
MRQAEPLAVKFSMSVHCGKMFGCSGIIHLLTPPLVGVLLLSDITGDADNVLGDRLAGELNSPPSIGICHHQSLHALAAFGGVS